MTDEFIQGDGSIRVREPDGRYQPVKTPAGFTDYAFRNIVAAADTAYRQYGKLPSVTEIQQFYPKVPVATISELVITDEFKAAMKYRGVEWEIDSGLSIEQSMVIQALTNPSDRRTTQVKLKELGIPMPRYQAWLRHPLFKAVYNQRSEDMLKDAIPMALNRLVGNAEASDQRAIEKLLEISGRYDPANKQIEDVRALVVRVIEAVIRNVPDKEQRAAIMRDIEAVQISHDLVRAQQEIER